VPVAKPPPDSVLQQASSDLLYEVAMLRNLVELKRTSEAITIPESVQLSPHDARQTLNNTIVESFATHTRVIGDFIYRDMGWANNFSREHGLPDKHIQAAHFFHDAPPKFWKRARPAETPSMNNARLQRVPNELAHLTTFRTDVEAEKQWNFTEIFRDLSLGLHTFLNKLPETTPRVVEEFHSRLRELLSSLREEGGPVGPPHSPKPDTKGATGGHFGGT